MAMRFAVGDDYARELALRFYDALLADSKPKSVATALTQAQSDADPKLVRLAYAERLIATFNALQNSDTRAALQAGSRALVYCVQAQAYEQLGEFASAVVTSSSDVRALQGFIPHLQAAANAAPQGSARWSCLCYLADALRRGCQIEASLPVYEEAANMAHAEASASNTTQAWADFAWISGNWANALRGSGQLHSARARQIASAEAAKKAGRPQINIIGSELEALRIAIIQGELTQAIPEVETRLAQVTSWWQQHQAGQAVPQAPDATMLARTFIGAIDIATHAARAKRDWASLLLHIETMLEVKQALKRPAQDIAIDRFNRANVLGELQRFDEARSELETCLGVFQGDPANSSAVLGSLAGLFYQQGDLTQAIQQQRRALALFANLPNSQDRAISHNNLAGYLEKTTQPNNVAESRYLQLAALLYRLCAGLGEHLQTSLRNYDIDYRRALANNSQVITPPIQELLSQPGVHSLGTWLNQWLAQNQSDLPQLQAEVDAMLAQVQQAVRDEQEQTGPAEPQEA